MNEYLKSINTLQTYLKLMIVLRTNIQNKNCSGKGLEFFSVTNAYLNINKLPSFNSGDKKMLNSIRKLMEAFHAYCLQTKLKSVDCELVNDYINSMQVPNFDINVFNNAYENVSQSLSLINNSLKSSTLNNDVALRRQEILLTTK